MLVKVWGGVTSHAIDGLSVLACEPLFWLGSPGSSTWRYNRMGRLSHRGVPPCYLRRVPNRSSGTDSRRIRARSRLHLSLDDCCGMAA